jgi:hypothetical protein
LLGKPQFTPLTHCWLGFWRCSVATEGDDKNLRFVIFLFSAKLGDAYVAMVCEML